MQKIINLANGATLLYDQNFSNDVNISIAFKVGKFAQNINGIAHLTEHLLMREGVCGENFSLSEYLLKNGISTSPAVGNGLLLLEMKASKNSFEKALAVIAKAINTFNVSQSALDAEKEVIGMEIDEYIDKGIDIPDNKEQLQEVTLQDIIDFKNQYITANNMIVNVDTYHNLGYTLKVCTHFANAIPSSNKTTQINYQKEMGFCYENAIDIEKIHRKTISVNVGLVCPFDKDFDYVIKKIFHKKFKGENLVKLFRESGEVLCYGIKQYYEAEMGVHYFEINTNANKLERTIEKLGEVFADLKNGLSVEEYNNIIKAFECDYASRKGASAHELTYQIIDYIDGYIERSQKSLCKISHEEVNKMLKTFMTNCYLGVDVVGEYNREFLKQALTIPKKLNIKDNLAFYEDIKESKKYYDDNKNALKDDDLTNRELCVVRVREDGKEIKFLNKKAPVKSYNKTAKTRSIETDKTFSSLSEEENNAAKEENNTKQM